MFFCAIASAERPNPPKIEDLCTSSPIIAVGECIRISAITSTERNSFQIITFDLSEMLKGRIFDIDLNSGMLGADVGRYISVLVQTQSIAGDHVIPAFKTGKKYVLFLAPHILTNLYVRSRVDDWWGEREANSDFIAAIKKIVSTTSESGKNAERKTEFDRAMEKLWEIGGKKRESKSLAPLPDKK